MNRVIHAITPGDHYSPRTGSAIPTVVHGLAGAARNDQREQRFPQEVLVASGTYTPRYSSAVPIEFESVPAPTRNERIADAALARLGRPRRAAARYFQPLVDALDRAEPAIVLAHNAPVLPWLLRNSQHRAVLYAHNNILQTMSKAEAGRTLDTVAGIVCVSESLAEQTRAHLPRSLADRVHIVGNGVDCTQFVPATRSATTPVRVLFVGRMIRDKGADVLLRAAALLDRDDIEILIVGSSGFDAHAALTPYERELRDVAARSRATVRFQPFEARENLPALFQSADVMVVPSRWPDPCPLAVGEGLAAGLPVVASRVGGIPEILGEAGVLVPKDDPRALALAIDRLVGDSSLRARMSAEARARAKAHDWAWAWGNLRGVLERL